MLVSRSSPFGGRTRTLVLLALGLLEESFARELARLLEVPVNGVQQALRGLEKDGLVAGRLAGRTRLYRLNPSYFARKELGVYLRRLAEPEIELTARIANLRKRPRRAGKPL
jgi:sugar-specific transcriptional regulator TrmB